MMLTAGTGRDDVVDTATASDAVLVRQVGRGDRVAHAELWLRHGDAARDAARRVVGDRAADEVLREVYARTEAALLGGLGGALPFRPYVYGTVRDVVAGRAGGARRLVHSPLAQAYRSLPEVWQSTLWYLDVEGLPATAVAPWLGLPAGAVPTVARTARAALGRAWAHAQARAWGDTPCAAAMVRVSRYRRGQLAPGAREALEAHLAACTRCSIAASEYFDVARRLGLVLVPGVLGAAAPAPAPAPALSDVVATPLPVPAHRPARARRRAGGSWPACASPARRQLWRHH
ncbi:zf-HC2 domain-containing protein [Puerhibacterium puerhi]|uniref:zf-HC2 domain-containing protein n=1 Tax=Puerhibacterium puerhi TaxID=2692623 RepID=UPI00135B3216|nr:zf-HC2 domain-containing protein [Puerhibacterium puerhi]